MKNLNLILLAAMLISCSANASSIKTSHTKPVVQVAEKSTKKPLLPRCVTEAKLSKCQVAQGKHRSRMIAHHATTRKALFGVASWYGGRWHGRKTASGQRFNQYGFTVAHKTLPFGTILRVTNVTNGRSVTVTVTDRGPYVRGREFDLSKAAASKIGITGVSVVSAEIIS